MSEGRPTVLRVPSVVALLLSICTALLLAPALAQQPRQRPSATKTALAPIVTVIQNDGSTARGRLTGIDVDHLTLTPPVTTTDPSPQPVTLSWADVKSVSNGLTRAKVLDDWRKEHYADLCPTCLGMRTLSCP